MSHGDKDTDERINWYGKRYCRQRATAEQHEYASNILGLCCSIDE